MKASVKNILAQKGYAPIFIAIDRTINDLSRAGYTTAEIKETLYDHFSDNSGEIDNYLRKKGY